MVEIILSWCYRLSCWFATIAFTVGDVYLAVLLWSKGAYFLNSPLVFPEIRK